MPKFMFLIKTNSKKIAKFSLMFGVVSFQSNSYELHPNINQKNEHISLRNLYGQIFSLTKEIEEKRFENKYRVHIQGFGVSYIVNSQKMTPYEGKSKLFIINKDYDDKPTISWPEEVIIDFIKNQMTYKPRLLPYFFHDNDADIWELSPKQIELITSDRILEDTEKNGGYQFRQNHCKTSCQLYIEVSNIEIFEKNLPVTSAEYDKGRRIANVYYKNQKNRYFSVVYYTNGEILKFSN